MAVLQHLTEWLFWKTLIVIRMWWSFFFKIKIFKSLKEVIESFFNVKNFKNPKKVTESFFGIKTVNTVMVSFFSIKNFKSREAVMEFFLSFKSFKSRKKVTESFFSGQASLSFHMCTNFLEEHLFSSQGISLIITTF